MIISWPGENLYAFVYNNPLNFIDPLGLRGIALGFHGQVVASGILDKAYGGGFGVYYNPDTGECGFYYSKTTSGDGYYLGGGGQIAGFSGRRPGGTTNMTNFFFASWGEDFDSGGYAFGPGGGYSQTREKTTAKPFSWSCGKCPF